MEDAWEVRSCLVSCLGSKKLLEKLSGREVSYLGSEKLLGREVSYLGSEKLLSREVSCLGS
jgi:hypothetical protein